MNDCWTPAEDAAPTPQTRAGITVATANVLSLFAGKDDKLAKRQYVPARMEALQLQCTEAAIDVIGIQETRHKAQHYFQCESFHVLSEVYSCG